MTKKISERNFTIILLILLVVLTVANKSYGASNDTSIKKIEVTPCINNLQQDSENSNIYRVSVNNSVSSVQVNVEPNDSNSKVSVQGNNGLDVGTNRVDIKITSESGNSDSYVIYVRRLSKEIADSTITPNVQDEKQEFTKIDNLEIQPADATQADSEDSNEIETNGILEDNMVSEENVVVEQLENGTAKWENNVFDDVNKRKMLIGGAIVFLIILIVIAIVVSRKKYKSKH